MRDLFLINPEVTFLNHGSFGACPLPVFEEYQRWQRELEWQPVEFFARRMEGLMQTAREALGAYVGANPDHLVFVSNATSGVNVVARSLQLAAGDEILATDHEYGACTFAWQYVCEKVGARYIQHPIPLPLPSAEEIVESLWSAVTPRTKLIFISHITSPTGLILPIEPIIRQARENGILTLVDGAHAPGHVPLDLANLGADFYTGNCHKWLCAPKGAAFLYARPEHHSWLYPLTISWGMMNPEPNLVNRHQFQGTLDLAPYLSVPKAIEFQQEHHWDQVRARCHEMAREMRTAFADLFQTEPIVPDSPAAFGQMIAALLPASWTADMATEAKNRLYDTYKIEIPFTLWNERVLLRASFQGYNTEADREHLVSALQEILASTH